MNWTKGKSLPPPSTDVAVESPKRPPARRLELKVAALLALGVLISMVLVRLYMGAHAGGPDDPGAANKEFNRGADVDGKNCTLTLASTASRNTSNPEYRAFTALADAFMNQNHWVKVQIIPYDHEPFKKDIRLYLDGSSVDDIIPWEAGEPIQPYKELLGDVSQVVNKWSGRWLRSIRQDIGALNEMNYFVPFKTYVWAVYYRKSVWTARGYRVPRDWQTFIGLAERMRSDGFKTPIAFGDREGWPALGTFDLLNMRINGFDFHKDLLQGKQAWDSAEVKQVFRKWAHLVPFYSEDWEELSYKQGVQRLMAETADKKAAMYLIGGFFIASLSEDQIRDIGVFRFPEIDPKWGNNAVDAPIDGFVLSKKSKNRRTAQCERAAIDFMEFLGSPDAFLTYDEYNKSGISVSNDKLPSTYTSDVQRDAAQILASPGAKIGRFLDREAEPNFAKNVVIPKLKEFLRNPETLDQVAGEIESARTAKPW